jgi:general nucleoside transport system permease protein
MMAILQAFLQAAVRTATPLALAAVGETVVERAGMINIGLEGVILAGAFGALLGASAGGVALGYVTAIAGGVAFGAVFGWCTISRRCDQIITGTAVNLLSLGVTGALYRGIYGSGGAALRIPTSPPIRLAGLASIPILGPMLFEQPVITYLLYLLVPTIWWWLYRTYGGLALRAVGERRESAVVAGIRPDAVRWRALLLGSALGGVSGGTLVLAQAGTFAEGMSAGRGFIAIAIVVLGRWNPVGAALAALFFGAVSALQFALQSMGWALPYQLFLALPYIVTLIALARVGGRSTAPAALGER